MPSFVPLIESYRGATLESVNFGAIAVSDTRGQLIASVGDALRPTFTRSTLKPLQALPFMQSGGARALGFTPRNLALLCASHSGETMHVEQVQQMLDKAGVGYQRLQCGCHVPYYVEQGLRPAPAEFDERHHNCSGKHAGFVAHCVHRGWALEDYIAPAHPLQCEVRRDVARAVGLAESELAMGIDGCSVPNYAMPLANLARGYARLASGAADGEFGESFEQLAAAMTAYPELVSGTGRNDLAFMQAGRGDWIAKAGADGVQALASKSRKQGIAIKIADGGKVAAAAATVAALDQLGWLDAAQREELRPWRAQEILSLRGAVVGERKPSFTLSSP